MNWIENPLASGCKVPSHSLAYRDLETLAPHMVFEREEQSTEDKYNNGYHNAFFLEGESEPGPKTWVEWNISFQSQTYDALGIEHSFNHVYASTAQGTIVFDDVARFSHHFPHVSEVGLTIYKHENGDRADNLRYVFATGIVNLNTKPFLDELKIRKNELRTYPRGHKTYLELLGTRLSRMVGALVIGGFPRGTRRISRIHVYGYCPELVKDVEAVKYATRYHMRWDIEPLRH